VSCTACTEQFLVDAYEQLQDMCRMYVGESLGDDLFHDTCIWLLEDTTGKYEEMCERGELWYYIARVLKINAFSKTTRFYYKYKKHKEIEDNTIDFHVQFLVYSQETEDTMTRTTKNKVAAINKVLADIPWFEREIFKVYYLHEHTLQTLSDATGINKNTIHKAIRRAKRKIQKHNEAQATNNKEEKSTE